MSINSIVHLYKKVLIISALLLWAYPMFAQLQSTEIKLIEACREGLGKVQMDYEELMP